MPSSKDSPAKESGGSRRQGSNDDALREPLLGDGDVGCCGGGGVDVSSSSLSATTRSESTLSMTTSTNGSGGGGGCGDERNSNTNDADEGHDDEDWKNIEFPLWMTRCFQGKCCGKRTSNNGNDGGADAETKPCKMNHNVVLNLIVCVLYGVSDSLWGGTVIAAYLKKIGGGRNTLVGDVEAASGLASLLSALPVGYLADTWGRSRVIASGGVMLLVTAVLHICILEWIGTDAEAAEDKPGVFWILAAIMALWGIGGGIVNGPAQALYADSTPEGDRSKYYVYLFSCYVLASCIGPLVSIILFQTLGDDWDLYHLRIILYIGLGMEIFNALVMMLFDDKKALKESDAGTSAQNGASGAGDNDDDSSREEQRSALVVAEEGAGGDSQQDQQQQSGSDQDAVEQEMLLAQRQRYIPYILFAHSLVFSFGSGMTVKFFPLFFKDQVGMSPSQVQVVYFLVPIVMACCSSLGQKLASYEIGAGTQFGRIQAGIVLKSLGVSCLFAIVIFIKYLDQNPFMLVPLYIMRTSFMNSAYPLEESVLMDFVPKNERARWKSLDSVSVFGWCGSAAIGGWLSDKHDYSYTFFITAILQAAGTLTWCLLLPLVPRNEGKKTTPSDGDSGANPAAGSGGETSRSAVDPDGHDRDETPSIVVSGSDSDNSAGGSHNDDNNNDSNNSDPPAPYGSTLNCLVPDSSLQEPLLLSSSSSSSS